MSNIIKFRFWNKHAKDWVRNSDGEISNCKVLNSLINNFGNGIDLKIQQFIGILDKNNREIYQGDVVKIDYIKDSKFLVDYEFCGFVFSNLNKDIPPPFVRSWISDGTAKEIEIIGNNFQNPELLNKN